MDPFFSVHPEINPYNYAANNPLNYIDPDGLDWYRNDSTDTYTWFEGSDAREGYTHLGGRGAIFGEFAQYLPEKFFTNGFTFSIADKRKGAMTPSSVYDPGTGEFKANNLWDEFTSGQGTTYTVFWPDHPYTENLQNSEGIAKGRNAVYSGNTMVKDRFTDAATSFTPLDHFPAFFTDFPRFWMGTVNYEIHRSADGQRLLFIVSDSKSRRSLFLHSPFPPNAERPAVLGNTYQFYLWAEPYKQAKKK